MTLVATHASGVPRKAWRDAAIAAMTVTPKGILVFAENGMLDGMPEYKPGRTRSEYA